jgi:hypothetical protein
MSFEDYELSVEGGKPYELFEFIYQGITERYTSADHTVTVNLVPYAPAPGLARMSEIEDTGKNVASQNMTIEAYPGFPPAELFARRQSQDDLPELVHALETAWASTLVRQKLPTSSLRARTGPMQRCR